MYLSERRKMQITHSSSNLEVKHEHPEGLEDTGQSRCLKPGRSQSFEAVPPWRWMCEDLIPSLLPVLEWLFRDEASPFIWRLLNKWALSPCGLVPPYSPAHSELWPPRYLFHLLFAQADLPVISFHIVRAYPLAMGRRTPS